MKNDILILAIESSCDETSVAIVKNGHEKLSNIVASQIKSHMRFGGVVPEIASRHHIEQITQVIDEALKVSSVSMQDIDAIAVTIGPGLVGSLLIGITAAKTLSLAYNKPLIAVNHMAGHIYASQLEQPMKFPNLSLLVSGGHTELVLMKDHLNFEVIGETRDDAVGEAYDKVGRILKLPYPGGKAIDELATQGNDTMNLPRAMLKEDNFDFSFSGLKSAVINAVHNAKQKNEQIKPSDLAASFQQAVIDILVGKTKKALEKYDVKQLIVAGGVAANSGLRQNLSKMIATNFETIDLVFPSVSLCGDNAAMIGAVAYQLYLRENFVNLNINAQPNLSL